MPEELIEGYDLSLSTPECFPGADWYRALVDLHNDISGVLPYLNAEFKGSDYHSAKILLWNGDGKKYAFRPREIVIAPVESRDEAQTLADHMVRTVNDIWIRRDRIEPNFEGKKPLLSVLDIYRLLPGTNCRECGHPSCMAFASLLRSGSTKASLCPYLSAQEYASLASRVATQGR